MHLILAGIAVVIVLAGAFFNRTHTDQGTVDRVVVFDGSDLNSTSDVKGDQDFDDFAVTPTLSQSPAVVSPTLPTTDSDYANLEYQYPGSAIVSSSGNMLELTSVDDPDIITNWYKLKIKDGGMNVTSFVTTKTNGNVLNKLVGADGSFEIIVEIVKSASDDFVIIKIHY